MNQLKLNKIGFSNELHNELQNENDLQITENHLHNTICGTNLSPYSCEAFAKAKNVVRSGSQTVKTEAKQSQRELEVQQSEVNEMNPKINESDTCFASPEVSYSALADLEQQKKLIKRQKYNAYMKSYRERKKKEIEDRIKSIDISLNEQTKSYNKDDIKQALFDCINTLINIINIHLDKFTNEAKNDIIKCQYSNDILQLTNTLNAYINSLFGSK